VATKISTAGLTDKDGQRIHPSWADAGEIALAIMRGEHDEYLQHIQNACKTRLKVSFRKGQRYLLKGTRSVDLEGKEATIIKVNAKSITVGVGTLTREPWGDSWSDGTYNVSPNLLAPLAS
jgi:hypothetical protein